MADPNVTDDPLAIDEPSNGRIHRRERRVELGDCSPRGRVRLDALARFLQDVSDDDTTTSGMDTAEAWVVRRADIGIHEWPTFREHVSLSTWCSGIGGRWAERRVRIRGDRGGSVDAAVLWVHLDAAGRPARLGDHFTNLYAPAAAGRKVRARLTLGAPPADAVGRSFPLRFADFDLMEHVNNAVSWVAVEEALATVDRPAGPLRAVTEHPGPIDRGVTPDLVVESGPDGLASWLLVDGAPASASRVVFGPPVRSGARRPQA